METRAARRGLATRALSLCHSTRLCQKRARRERNVPRTGVGASHAAQCGGARGPARLCLHGKGDDSTENAIQGTLRIFSTILPARAVQCRKSAMAGSFRREADGRSSGAVREKRALGRGGGRQPAWELQHTAREPQRGANTKRETDGCRSKARLAQGDTARPELGGRLQPGSRTGRRRQITGCDRSAAAVVRQVGVARAQCTHWVETAAT